MTIITTAHCTCVKCVHVNKQSIAHTLCMILAVTSAMTTKLPSHSQLSHSSALKSLGDDLWKKTDKISAELFVLTYGSLVSQLIQDHQGNYEMVNAQLDKMGYNIGIRLIEDFLARSSISVKCTNFKETIEIVTKVDS